MSKVIFRKLVYLNCPTSDPVLMYFVVLLENSEEYCDEQGGHDVSAGHGSRVAGRRQTCPRQMY